MSPDPSSAVRRPAAAWITRRLVDRFWAPVGSGEQAAAELRFHTRYLFGDAAGRAAARRVDATIRRLPGFSTVRLLEAWMDRQCPHTSLSHGGRHDHADR